MWLCLLYNKFQYFYLKWENEVKNFFNHTVFFLIRKRKLFYLNCFNSQLIWLLILLFSGFCFCSLMLKAGLKTRCLFYLKLVRNTSYLSDNELITQYIRNLYISKAKQASNMNKNGQRSWIDIFPKKACELPTDTWKMFNITKHQGNANQNYNDVSSHK